MEAEMKTYRLLMAVAAVIAFSRPCAVNAQVQFKDTTVAHSSKAYPSPLQKIDEPARGDPKADIADRRQQFRLSPRPALKNVTGGSSFSPRLSVTVWRG